MPFPKCDFHNERHVIAGGARWGDLTQQLQVSRSGVIIFLNHYNETFHAHQPSEK